MIMTANVTPKKSDAGEVYTIGHSNHSSGDFLRILKKVGITAVADVRSTPYSRRFPHFNHDKLKNALSKAGITYAFLGDRLGARPKDRSCYLDGKADYDLISKTEAFKEGIDSIQERVSEFRMALMCAEREPLDCHRTILVSRRLQEKGVAVKHILADGTVEPNDITEKRLLRLMKMETGDLFASLDDRDGQLTEAYRKRGDEIAYREEGAAG